MTVQAVHLISPQKLGASHLISPQSSLNHSKPFLSINHPPRTNPSQSSPSNYTSSTMQAFFLPSRPPRKPPLLPLPLPTPPSQYSFPRFPTIPPTSLLTYRSPQISITHCLILSPSSLHLPLVCIQPPLDRSHPTFLTSSCST